MKELLTASRMAALLSCPRKHFWRYEIGLKHETEATYFRFGTAWHAGTEAFEQHQPYENALALALPESMQLDGYDCATIAALLAAYYARYSGQELFRDMHTEVQFQHAIAGSKTFDAAGKIDGLGVLWDGRHAVKEKKTASEDLADDSDYWLRLRANGQLFQYALAARTMGWEVNCAIYDVVRKPAIAPKQVPILDPNGKKIVHDAAGTRVYKKDGSPRESGDTEKGYTLESRIETPEEFGARLATDTQERPGFYFARREVPILDADLAEFVQQRLVLGKQILMYRALENRLEKRERAWPRNVSSMQCRTCEYKAFCLQNVNINPSQPPAGFKIGGIHSEL